MLHNHVCRHIYSQGRESGKVGGCVAGLPPRIASILYNYFIFIHINYCSVEFDLRYVTLCYERVLMPDSVRKTRAIVLLQLAACFVRSGLSSQAGCLCYKSLPRESSKQSVRRVNAAKTSESVRQLETCEQRGLV